MTSQEIKSEIQKSLDKVPNSVLEYVLKFLKQAEKSSDSVSIAKNLRNILSEDRALLERLAK